MSKIVIRNLLIHIAVNICNPPTFTINKLKSWVPHAYYYISSSILNCFVFSYLSAFQRTQIVPKPLSGLIKLGLLGLPTLSAVHLQNPGEGLYIGGSGGIAD